MLLYPTLDRLVRSALHFHTDKTTLLRVVLFYKAINNVLDTFPPEADPPQAEKIIFGVPNHMIQGIRNGEGGTNTYLSIPDLKKFEKGEASC